MIIRIKNLQAHAVIGAYDWEKTRKWKLLINVELEIDGDKAIVSDHVDDTVDYDNLSKIIIKEVENSRFSLLEKLAAYLVEKVMEDKKIKRVRIEIDKPGVVTNAESVSVVEERSR